MSQLCICLALSCGSSVHGCAERGSPEQGGRGVPLAAAPRAGPQPHLPRGCSAELPESLVSQTNSPVLKKPVRGQPTAAASSRGGSLQRKGGKRKAPAGPWWVIAVGVYLPREQCPVLRGAPAAPGNAGEHRHGSLSQWGGVSGVSQACTEPRFGVGQCNTQSVSVLHSCHGLRWLE